MALYRVPVTLDGRHLAPLIEADGRDQARSKAEAVVRAMSRHTRHKTLVLVGEPVRELERPA